MDVGEYTIPSSDLINLLRKMSVQPNVFFDDVYSLYENFDTLMQKFDINFWPQEAIWFRMHSAITVLHRLRKRSKSDSTVTKEERLENYVDTNTGDLYSREYLKKLLKEIHFHVKILLNLEKQCVNFFYFFEHIDIKVCLGDLCKRMSGAIAFKQFIKTK